jgi:hypothetical protein
MRFHFFFSFFGRISTTFSDRKRKESTQGFDDLWRRERELDQYAIIYRSSEEEMCPSYLKGIKDQTKKKPRRVLTISWICA